MQSAANYLLGMRLNVKSMNLPKSVRLPRLVCEPLKSRSRPARSRRRRRSVRRRLLNPKPRRRKLGWQFNELKSRRLRNARGSSSVSLRPSMTIPLRTMKVHKTSPLKHRHPLRARSCQTGLFPLHPPHCHPCHLRLDRLALPSRLLHL
jgi:hypothetical protein